MREDEFVASVLTRYTTCKSYKDSGKVKVTPSCGGSILAFETYYAPGNKFRMDWTTYHERERVFEIVWTDGVRTFQKLVPFHEPVSCDSIEMALAAAMPSNHGLGLMVPPMLISHLRSTWKPYWIIGRPTRIGEETIDSNSCTILESFPSERERIKTSVLSESLTIIRIEKTFQSKEGAGVVIVDYNEVEFDAEILDERFDSVLVTDEIQKRLSQQS